MAQVNSYKDLLVWQKGMEIVSNTYALTAKFPKEEIFGLTSQARRAAVSIPLNIAEGYGRKSSGSYKSFLQIAQASNQELETALLIAVMLKFVNEKDCDKLTKLITEESKMLHSLIEKIKAKINN